MPTYALAGKTSKVIFEFSFSEKVSRPHKATFPIWLPIGADHKRTKYTNPLIFDLKAETWEVYKEV